MSECLPEFSHQDVVFLVGVLRIVIDWGVGGLSPKCSPKIGGDLSRHTMVDE